MSATLRSAITLGVLGTIMLAWLFWGLEQTTKPFPGRAEVPTCVDVAVPAGERVSPGDVTVSVLNAGTREGLAGRTMQLFADAGFGVGDSNNAPEGTDVAYAQVWTEDPTSPAVRLVMSRLAGATIVDQASATAGVTIVVGDDFNELAAGKKSVKAKNDSVVCGPPTA